MTNARITSDWINAMSDNISEAKASENRPTMTAMVRKTCGTERMYGPYPYEPGQEFGRLGATVDEINAILAQAVKDGATTGYAEIVYFGKGGRVVDEEIAII